jgi:hypothetical protein
MIYMGVFSTFLALKADHTVYKGFTFSASSLSETNRFLRTELKQSADISSLNSTELLVKQIETLKLKLVMVFEPEIKDLTLPDGSFNYADICAKDKKLAYEDFNNAGLQSINQQLIEFYKLHDNNDKNTLRLMNEIDTYRLQRTNNKAPLITYLPIIAVMNVLTDWQNKILLIEYLYNHPQIES